MYISNMWSGWLTLDALRNLDNTLAEECKRLNKNAKQRRSNKVEKRIGELRGRPSYERADNDEKARLEKEEEAFERLETFSRRWKVKDSSDESRVANDFQRLLDSEGIDRFLVRDLEAELLCGDSSVVSLTIRNAGSYSLHWREYISDDAERITKSIRRWLNINKHGRLNQFLNDAGLFLQFVTFMGMLWCLLMAAAAASMAQNSASAIAGAAQRNATVSEARKLIESGIDEKSRDKAIVLLLRLNTGIYSQSGTTMQTPAPDEWPWPWLIAAGAFGIAWVFLLVLPGTEFEIGRRAGTHKWKQKWYSFANKALWATPVIMVITGLWKLAGRFWGIPIPL